MSKMFYFAVPLVLLLISQAAADNWGHWRGPTGNGIATGAAPPIEWSKMKNVKWKVDIPGRGSGSPIIGDDQVFVVTAVSAQVEMEAGRFWSHEHPEQLR